MNNHLKEIEIVLKNMGLNLTKLVFLFFTLIVLINSLILHLIEDYMPLILKRTFCYGKYSVKQDHFIVRNLEVPKRWFQHFYLFSAPMFTCGLVTLILKYSYNIQLPSGVDLILDLQLGSLRQPLVSPGNTWLAMILITIHCWKRLYETHCISVFSNTKINISHYIVGYGHYIGVITCIIGESYGFMKDGEKLSYFQGLTSFDWLCALIFLWASYEQLQSNIILANLRKNKKGLIITNSYKIPYGRLFDFISAPLQLTEIIMYFMLSMILWQSSSFHYVFIWVLVNQTETAISTHEWYKRTFQNYPLKRNICIPFIF